MTNLKSVVHLALVAALALAVPTAAHAANGLLKVTSFPTGAEVWVDGVATGKVTPMSVSVAEGEHVVKVQFPGSGWTADERTITIVPGNNDLSVTLLPSLDAEAKLRQEADAALQKNIDAEAAARVTSDAFLGSDLVAEAAARQAGDAGLQTSIEAEAAARAAADAALQGNIDAEAAAREQAFGAAARLSTSNIFQNPGTEIPQILGPIGALPKEPGTEIFASNPLEFVTLDLNTRSPQTFRWQATDAWRSDFAKNPETRLELFSSGSSGLTSTGFGFNLNGTITFAPGQSFPGVATVGALNGETAARLAADEGLQGTVATETSARVSADGALHAALDAEVLSRQQGDAAILAAANNYTDQQLLAGAAGLARLSGGNAFTGDQSIAGTLNLSGGGIRFPDGTTQTTAATRTERAQSRTIVVGSMGTPTENGAALLNAMAAITDSSYHKPYLVKLEPGHYDVGTSTLVLRPDVVVEGSGRDVTVIRGTHYGTTDWTAVRSSLGPGGFLYGPSHLKNLTVHAEGYRSIGLWIDLGTSVVLNDVRIYVFGYEAIGVLAHAGTGATFRISRSVVSADGNTATGLLLRGETWGQATLEETSVYAQSELGAYAMSLEHWNATVRNSTLAATASFGESAAVFGNPVAPVARFALTELRGNRTVAGEGMFKCVLSWTVDTRLAGNCVDRIVE